MYKCVPKDCPGEDTCGPNLVESKSSTLCCTSVECLCSCTDIGTPSVKPFHCNNTFDIEANCDYLITKFSHLSNFNISVSAVSCSELYPHMTSPPVSCVKEMKLYYNGVFYKIDAEYNKVYVDSSHIISNHIGEVDITFATNNASVLMFIEELGLHVLYFPANLGKFDIYLKQSNSTISTEGICGNCSGENEVVDCQVEPSNVTEYAVNETCEPPCTGVDKCKNPECANSRNCVQNPCRQCGEWGSNPCDVLLEPLFAECFDDVNEEHERCTYSMCFFDETTVLEQCDVCNNIELRRSIDKCPSCINYYAKLGCVNETAQNTSCPENQVIQECEDSCNLPVSCDDLTTQSCGVLLVTSCSCPDGYVKESSSSEKCIPKECCTCNETLCPDMPANFVPQIIGVDHCGCNISSDSCVCTEDCANPNFPNKVMHPGEIIVDNSNSCITYRCPQATPGECNEVAKSEVVCNDTTTCPDERYELRIDPNTAEDCCPKYDCFCINVTINGQSYQVGDSIPDPEDPICSNLTVVRKSPEKCPETITEKKDCSPHSCSSCETEIFDSYDQCCGNTYRCEPKTCCTSDCVNPETQAAINPGETVLSSNPCITYYCPEEESGKCGQVTFNDRSDTCASLASLGCGDQKVPRYNESDACCAVECVCIPQNSEPCESQYQIKENTTGECPSQICICDCPDVFSDCDSVPGCKSNVTSYSEDECKCPTSITCIPDTDVCTAPPTCGSCLYAKAIGSDQNDNACNSSCDTYQCTKVECTENTNLPESCGDYKRFESYYLPGDTDKCCPITECNCLPESELMHICPQWNKTCGENYTKTLVSEEHDCCPEYECECVPENCPPPVVCPWGRLWTNLPTVTIGVHDAVCCNTTICNCVNITCFPPPFECPDYHTIQIDNTTNPCCPIYTCECDVDTFPANTTNPIYIPDSETNICDNVPGQNPVPVVHPSECFSTCECLPSDEAKEKCPDNIYMEAECVSPKYSVVVEKPTNDTRYTCCEKLSCECPPCEEGYITEDQWLASLREDQDLHISTPNQECCPLFTPVCKDPSELTDMCSQYNVSCPPNYAKKKNETDIDCCETYYCECEACVFEGATYSPGEKWYALVDGACTALICSQQVSGCSIDTDTADCSFLASSGYMSISVDSYSDHPLDSCKQLKCVWNTDNGVCSLDLLTQDRECQNAPNCPTDKEPHGTKDNPNDCCETYTCVCKSCGANYTTVEEIEKSLGPDQKIVQTINQECCANYTAVCKDESDLVNLCSAYDVVCPTNYKRKRNDSDIGCCEAYHCECDVSSCPDVPKCDTPKILSSSFQEGQCCLEYTCICPIDPNENITCEAPYIIETANNNTCLSKYCRCPNENECQREATAVCQSTSGCRAVVTKRDECDCVIESDCIGDPTPCDDPPSCGNCSDVVIVSTYTVVGDCNSTCNQYQCQRRTCPIQAPLPQLCAWNNISTSLTENDCCSEESVICDSKNCPFMKCDGGYHKEIVMGEYIDAAHSCPDLDCCKKEKCVCDVCFYNNVSYNVGDRFNDTTPGSCLIYECTGSRDQPDGCYKISTEAPYCSYTSPSGTISRVSVDAFFDDPEDKCKRITCKEIIQEDDQCFHYLHIEQDPCILDITCPDFMEPDIIQPTGEECCATYKCICKDCGSNYTSGMDVHLEPYEELVYVPIDINPNQLCCPRTQKHCANETVLMSYCPEWDKQCPSAYIRKRRNYFDCCPTFDCICDETKCAEGRPHIAIHDCQEVVNKTLEENPNQDCCPETKIYCKDPAICCVNKTCGEDEVMKQLDSLDPLSGYCCPTQECECVDYCGPGYITEEYLISILQVGQVVMSVTPDKKCCGKYDIFCKPDVELEHDCSVYNITCPAGEIRYPDSTIGCCSTYTCICDTCLYNGEIHDLGDMWVDSTKPCSVFECTSYRQQDGCYSVDETPGECSYNNFSYPVGSEIPTSDPCRTLRCKENSILNGQCLQQFVEEIQTCNTLTCGQYEVKNETYTDGICCPHLECICASCGDDYPGSGVDREIEVYEKIVPMSVSENPDFVCCPRTKIVCQDYSVLINVCPQFGMTNEDCGAWQQLNRTNSLTECCPEYTCECLECPFFSPLRELYQCEEYINQSEVLNPISHCCPRQTIQCQAEEACCTIPECGEYQEVYDTGGRDPNTNNCCPKYECRCKTAEALQHVCPHANFTCPENYNKIPNNTLTQDICCQTYECQCYGCLENNVVYPIDAVWCADDNHCLEMKCVENKTHCPNLIVYQKFDCIDIDQAACLEGGGEVMPNMTTEGCCFYCHTPGSCHAIENYEDVVITNANGVACSKTDVNIPKCDGTCATLSDYNTLTGDFDTTCNCCKSTAVESRTEDLLCDNGDIEPYNYNFITSCDCQQTACAP
uniref:kielin/chordin-like protein n=1 Tax=Styela clava TaxID=7725 RepID=UPI001939A128|nr:kielin/chordin-like protein [Styela clava]